MNSKPKKRLSIDELKSYPGFENCTDEIAEETIASLEALSILFFLALSKNNQRERKIARDSDEKK